MSRDDRETVTHEVYYAVGPVDAAGNWGHADTLGDALVLVRDSVRLWGKASILRKTEEVER